MSGLFNKIVLCKDIELVVCCPIPGKVLKKECCDGVEFWGYPITDMNIETFKKIINIEKPDVIHIFGTEYKRSYDMAMAADELGLSSRTVIGIQGMVSVIGQYHYYGGVPISLIHRLSIKDLLKKGSLANQRKEMLQRGKYEQRAIKMVSHVIGRTDWDYACTKQINPGVHYHFCNESLRDTFYNRTWNIESCERHSIFVSQSSYPIKGMHVAIEALAQIVKSYPDAHLYTTGKDLMNQSLKNRLSLSAYQKYLVSMIKHNHLENNVTFLGVLDEKAMAERFLKSNVFVSASSIENSPNSVGEAMIMGVPVVSSDVGGVKNLMEHGKEGYIYPFDEPYMLAHYVECIFSDDKLATFMGENARAHAQKTHDSDTNAAQMLSIYKNIIG